MNLTDLLSLLSSLAVKNNLSTPFICGGVPRDRYLNKIEPGLDIDITTGDLDSHRLAKLLHTSIPNSTYKIMPDSHATVHIDKLKVDFSSNFNVPGIKELLQQAGKSNPTPMECELFSRDFTCNALLLSLDLKNIYDPTGLGIKDCDNQLIRTCLPATITLTSDPKRIIRIIYLASKLNFEIDPEIIEFVKKNPTLITHCKPKYLRKKLKQAVDYNLDKTVELLDLLGLWKHIPIIPELLDHASLKPGRL